VKIQEIAEKKRKKVAKFAVRKKPVFSVQEQIFKCLCKILFKPQKTFFTGVGRLS